MTDWNAGQYLKFEDERTRPARDLLTQVPLTAVRYGVDLGCGPGNSTELIAARYPGATLTGVDMAPDMLAAARRRLPSAHFVEADIATYEPAEPVDLFFTNAVLQWLPAHMDLLPRLMAKLAPGGVLAIQLPDNLAEPMHADMREVATSAPFVAKLGPVAARRQALPPVADYYDRLKSHASRVDIWHTIYNHPLADAAAIVEWVKGTGLRPFLEPLGEAERGDFIARYQALLARDYPPRIDGKVLLAFPRLFMVAVR